MGFLVWCSSGMRLTLAPLQDILRGQQMLFHRPLESCSPGAGLQSPAGWEARGGTWGPGKWKEDHQHEDAPKLRGSSQQNGGRGKEGT